MFSVSTQANDFEFKTLTSAHDDMVPCRDVPGRSDEGRWGAEGMRCFWRSSSSAKDLLLASGSNACCSVSWLASGDGGIWYGGGIPVEVSMAIACPWSCSCSAMGRLVKIFYQNPYCVLWNGFSFYIAIQVLSNILAHNVLLLWIIAVSTLVFILISALNLLPWVGKCAKKICIVVSAYLIVNITNPSVYCC